MAHALQKLRLRIIGLLCNTRRLSQLLLIRLVMLTLLLQITLFCTRTEYQQSAHNKQIHNQCIHRLLHTRGINMLLRHINVNKIITATLHAAIVIISIAVLDMNQLLRASVLLQGLHNIIIFHPVAQQ